MHLSLVSLILILMLSVPFSWFESASAYHSLAGVVLASKASVTEVNREQSALYLDGTKAIRGRDRPLGGNTYTSPQFGYVVMWEAPWVLEATQSVPGESDYLRLSVNDVYMEFHGVFTTADLTSYAEPVVHEFLGEFAEERRLHHPDLVVEQEWALPGGSARYFPMILSFTSATGVAMTEAVDIGVVKPGESAYIWVYGRSSATSPEELRALSEKVTHGPGQNTPPPPSQSSTLVPGCDVVEIYPGYPGYRGYVTGIHGIGDHACLQDLVAQAPGFSRDREDAANQEAAQRLGIVGSMKEWTWENWLAIEAARGLVPTCYACIILSNPPIPAQTMGVIPDPADPRLLMGSPAGGDAAVRRLAVEHDVAHWRLMNVFPSDLHLRALAALVNSGQHLNAPQTLEVYDVLVEAMTTPGQFMDARPLYQAAISQGGFVPTPANAVPEDQLFMVFVSVDALCPFWPAHVCGLLMQLLEVEMYEWHDALLRDINTPSFAEWLQDRGAENWLR